MSSDILLERRYRNHLQKHCRYRTQNVKYSSRRNQFTVNIWIDCWQMVGFRSKFIAVFPLFNLFHEVEVYRSIIAIKTATNSNHKWNLFKYWSHDSKDWTSIGEISHHVTFIRKSQLTTRFEDQIVNWSQFQRPINNRQHILPTGLSRQVSNQSNIPCYYDFSKHERLNLCVRFSIHSE